MARERDVRGVMGDGRLHNLHRLRVSDSESMSAYPSPPNTVRKVIA